jgi:hypothetical protein
MRGEVHGRRLLGSSGEGWSHELVTKLNSLRVHHVDVLVVNRMGRDPGWVRERGRRSGGEVRRGSFPDGASFGLGAEA